MFGALVLFDQDRCAIELANAYADRPIECRSARVYRARHLQCSFRRRHGTTPKEFRHSSGWVAL